MFKSLYETSLNLILCSERKTKVLIRLRGCAGWSWCALVVAYNKVRVSRVKNLLRRRFMWQVFRFNKGLHSIRVTCFQCCCPLKALSINGPTLFWGQGSTCVPSNKVSWQNTDNNDQCSYIIWASSQENLSSGTPTKQVSNQSPQLHFTCSKFTHDHIQNAKSDCVDAQAGLRLCCSQTLKTDFLIAISVKEFSNISVKFH